MRRWTLTVLNWLFFGFIVVGSVLVQAGVVEVFSWPFVEVFPADGSNVLLLVGFIFVFNLALSGFLLVTLTGFAFSGFSLFFLSLRGLLWGILLIGLSTPAFLAALPTLILEGEGYALAALAGVNLGLSWLKPNWAYRGEGDLSRSEAAKKALKDCGRIYVVVALFLFLAAVVEAVTIIFIR